jgi:hypothetical protein
MKMAGQICNGGIKAQSRLFGATLYVLVADAPGSSGVTGYPERRALTGVWCKRRTKRMPQPI